MEMEAQLNPLQELGRLGQSPWLDDIRRGWLADGTLARLVEEDGLAGLTSNPAIFEKAIAAGGDYDAAIRGLARAGADAGAIYEALVLEDVRDAADLLAPTYEASGGADGFVSLEVSPHHAHDTTATLEEARRLWRAFGRDNAMIKVPGTAAGLPAIRTLVAEGVNVNVTLLFHVDRYREVVECFIAGLERRREAGQPIAHVASVASFFLSRIDTLVDRSLDAIGNDEAKALRGKAAIAAARLAYAHYREWTSSERWRHLEAAGGRPQRLLWASTSTKDPAYQDTRYVEALIGPHTVNTMPFETLEAYRDHGHPEPRLERDLDAARETWKALSRLGINPREVGHRLESEGVRKFIDPFDKLHALLEKRRGGWPANG